MEETPSMAELRTWLSVDDYAAATGTSVRTVRRRLAEGSLTAGKLGSEWRIKPPPPRVPPPAPERPPDPPPVSATALVPLDQVERLLAPILTDRDALRTERDELRQQIDELHTARLQDADARRTDAEELGRLRGRLEALEAELERARQDRAANRHPPTTAPPSDPPRRWRWPWQR